MTLDDLKKFSADKDDPRWYIREPWTRDGFTYATNGHILVRVPAIEGVEDCAKATDIAALLAKQVPPAITASFVAVPNVPAQEKSKCLDCHGTGMHECDCDDEHKCGYCGGTGETEPAPVSVAVGNAYFANTYLALIRGWEIAPNGNEAAWIRNGEALGLLMPRRGP